MYPVLFRRASFAHLIEMDVPLLMIAEELYK